MTRGVIEPIAMDKIPEDYVDTAEMMQRHIGDATTIQVWLHSKPSTDFYFKDFYPELFYNNRAGVSVGIREKQLARLRISKRKGCSLCNRNNEEEVLSYGVRQDQIDALFDLNPDPALFTEADLALIELTDRMLDEGQLDKDLYGRLNKHFSDQQIVEIGFVIGVMLGANRFMFVYDLVPRDGTCSISDRKQLEAAE